MIKSLYQKTYQLLSPYKFAQKFKREISFDFNHNKTALLSYIQAPFAYKDQNSCKATHANYAAAWEIVYILRDLGFNVDVVEASERLFVPQKDYALLIGTLDCIDRFKPYLSDSCVTIFYALGVYVDARNGSDGELGRVQALEKRRGKHYVPKRLFMNPEGIRRSIEKADHVSITGGEATYHTFAEHIRSSKASLCTMPIYPETIPKPIDVPLEQRTEFLWFFGYGQVHKGLDLVIDAFAEMPDCTLNIVGTMEPDFERIYGSTIDQCANIHYHGYLDTSGNKFKTIVDKCLAFIAPTVNEGISCACVTSIQLGLYPIMTPATGVDLPDGLGLNLALCTKEEIKSKMAVLQRADKNQMQLDLLAMREWSIDEYSPFKFKNQFRSIIKQAFKK